MEGEDIARARAGDRHALHRVVSVYRPRIYRYCRARLANHATADDVTQEVCEALCASLARHRGPDSSFSAFVFGIAANKVAMHHRGRSRRPEQITDTPPDSIDSALSPEERALAAETSSHVAALLARLPEQTRQILLLRVAAGLSADETATVLQMSPGAVRVAQHRGLHQLRALAGLEVQS